MNDEKSDKKILLINIMILISIAFLIIGYNLWKNYRQEKELYEKRYNYVSNEIKMYFSEKYNINKNDIEINSIDFFKGQEPPCIDGCSIRRFVAIITYENQKYRIVNGVENDNYKPNPDNWEVICDEKDECAINGEIID